MFNSPDFRMASRWDHWPSHIGDGGSATGLDWQLMRAMMPLLRYGHDRYLDSVVRRRCSLVLGLGRWSDCTGGAVTKRLSRRWLATSVALISTVSMVTAFTATSSSASTSKAPITIAFMAVETGTFAAPSRNNDIALAIKQINSTGGVDGHKLQYTVYDSNVTPQQAVTATQKALGTKPTAFIGYNVDDQIQATAQVLKQSAIPVLSLANGPASSAHVADVSNLFTTIPVDVLLDQAMVKYVVDKDHPKSVGIFHTDDTASNFQGATLLPSLLKKMGVKNVSVVEASDAATDVTAQALAMKHEDAVLEVGFPTVEALLNTALNQEGYTGPIIGDTSGPSIAAEGLNKPSELTNYTYTPYCAPALLSSKQAKSYVSEYRAAYPGQNIVIASPQIYDAVGFLSAAIKADGGNLSPSAITKQMKKITYTGVCGAYHSDQNQDLIRTTTLVSTAKGVDPGTLVATYIQQPASKVYFKSS
jgi:branched-chain amino acid transport system substrate-binding protein